MVLDTALRDRFLFSLHNGKVKRRVLAKREVTLAEAFAAEVVDREANPRLRTGIAAIKMKPVHQGMTGDTAIGHNTTLEDVLWLRDAAGARWD